MAQLIRRVAEVALAWAIVVDVILCTAWLSPLYLVGLADRPTGRQIVSGYVGWAAINGMAWALTAERVIDTIFFWDPGHCRAVVRRERAACERGEWSGVR